MADVTNDDSTINQVHKFTQLHDFRPQKSRGRYFFGALSHSFPPAHVPVPAPSAQVAHFATVTGASDDEARFFLDAANGDLQVQRSPRPSTQPSCRRI